MIVVRVELHSAGKGSVTELARMEIFNDESGTDQFRNYGARTLRGRNKESLDQHIVQRTGAVRHWPSASLHVWNLVATALRNMRYDAGSTR